MNKTNKVNALISDLFFMVDMHDCLQLDAESNFAGYNKRSLEAKARELIELLASSDVIGLPTPKDLVEDFLKRV